MRKVPPQMSMEYAITKELMEVLPPKQTETRKLKADTR